MQDPKGQGRNVQAAFGQCAGQPEVSLSRVQSLPRPASKLRWFNYAERRNQQHALRAELGEGQNSVQPNPHELSAIWMSRRSLLGCVALIGLG